MAVHVNGVLVPDFNTMEDRTPLWHNNQTQVPKVADLGSDFGLVGLQNTLA